MSEERQFQKQLQVRFTDESVQDVFYCNAFQVVSSLEDAILTLGTITPPFISGTPEEQKIAIEKMDFVAPKRVVQVIIPIEKLKELHVSISIALRNAEKPQS